jgi:gluconokinase
MILILMGVSGSGKSTVGRTLAKVLEWDFIEGDDLHPPENVRKMSQGIPLQDSDRWPWLEAIRHNIEALQADDRSAIITCSALKQSYRDLLQDGLGDLKFIYLKGSRETLQSRLEERQGHFMKEQMLDSQLATLEEPEDAIVMNEDELDSVEQTVQAICDRMALT